MIGISDQNPIVKHLNAASSTYAKSVWTRLLDF